MVYVPIYNILARIIIRCGLVSVFLKTTNIYNYIIEYINLDITPIFDK